jgi:glycerol uptake facilitator protein
MFASVLGEFMGTMMMVLMGNGVIANVRLRRSKAEGAGWFAITAGWAFAVMAGIFTAVACGSPDAHLNPALTLGLAIVSGDFGKLASYVPAQLLGAMVGASLVWLHFLPHWKVTEDGEAKRACFTTSPAIRKVGANLISEIIGTFVLVVGACAIASKRVAPAGLPAGLGPYLVGVLVWAIGLSLGGTTGYAINPARDLGPRLMHQFLPLGKKTDSDWGYALIPIAGPLIGASLAGLLVSQVRF